MDGNREDSPVERGASFRHDDGSVEIVFRLAGDRVLSVSEYPSVDAFRDAIADADYEGEHEGVLDLPPIESFPSEK